MKMMKTVIFMRRQRGVLDTLKRQLEGINNTWKASVKGSRGGKCKFEKKQTAGTKLANAQ
jgi:hypothetical protein